MHFEVTAFLTAAIGLLGLISFCLLVFGRLGVGSIIAFLVAGVVIELCASCFVRAPPGDRPISRTDLGAGYEASGFNHWRGGGRVAPSLE